MRKYLIIVAAIVIALSYMYWPSEFDESFDCVSLVIGADSYENIQVNIKGIIKKSLIRDDYIMVKLSIDGEDYPDNTRFKNILPWRYEGLIYSHGEVVAKNTEYVEVDIDSVEDYYRVRLGFDNVMSGGSTVTDVFGNLYISRDFETILLTFSEKNGTGYI